MKLIVQEDNFGCGIACVASILSINYQTTRTFFSNGTVYAKTRGFLCREIIEVLNDHGHNYTFKYLKQYLKNKIYIPDSIVFLKRSKRYPAGHYLVRGENSWIDPWINFPNEKRVAGFRKRLPGKPIYIIYKK